MDTPLNTSLVCLHAMYARQVQPKWSGKKESHHWWANSVTRRPQLAQLQEAHSKSTHCTLAPVLSALLRLGSHNHIEEQIERACAQSSSVMTIDFEHKTLPKQNWGESADLLALRRISTTRRNINQIGNNAETKPRRANFRTHAKSCK